MRRIVALLFFVIFPVFAFANPIDDKCAQHTYKGAPILSDDKDSVYLCRTGYAVAYSTKYKNPTYVIERVTKERIGEEPRTEDFRPDIDIKPEHQATLQDFSGAGYDRGHMSPAANNGSNKEAMSQSFLLSNMVPQNPGNNRGIWKQVEVNVRNWVIKSKDLYVIQGPIFDEGYKTIGPNKVAVPTRLYKIIIDNQSGFMLAFIFPNDKLEIKDLPKFIVTVDEIEKVTNINFSPNLTEGEEVHETIKGSSILFESP